MCFNFPLMPRMFMAVRREQRFPITEILAQTPPIPDGCQWGIFLRNHDELTLEMVTDEERDYMYAEYARDPRMRRNLGIRRRLAPLVDNDRRVAELLYGLLLSLPGSPVLYYGDELSWATTSTSGTVTGSARPCSGRLTATPASPGPTSPSSICRRSWTRCTGTRPSTSRRSRGIPRRSCTGCGGCWRYGTSTPNSQPARWRCCRPTTRRCSPTCDRPATSSRRSGRPRRHGPCGREPGRRGAALDGASLWDVGPDSVGAPVVTAPNMAPTAVLCVANLSRFAQPAELSLGRWEGRTPIELLGRVPFPKYQLGPVLGHTGPLRHLLVRAGGAAEDAPSPHALEALVIPYLERQPWFLADMSRFDREPARRSEACRSRDRAGRAPRAGERGRHRWRAALPRRGGVAGSILGPGGARRPPRCRARNVRRRRRGTCSATTPSRTRSCRPIFSPWPAAAGRAPGGSGSSSPSSATPRSSTTSASS